MGLYEIVQGLYVVIEESWGENIGERQCLQDEPRKGNAKAVTRDEKTDAWHGKRIFQGRRSQHH